VQRDLLGRPEQARDFWGQPIESAEGRRPAGGSTVTTSGGDAVAAILSLFLAVGLPILLVYLISAVLALVAQVLSALVNGWRSLVERYPRAIAVPRPLRLCPQLETVPPVADLTRGAPSCRLIVAQSDYRRSAWNSWPFVICG